MVLIESIWMYDILELMIDIFVSRKPSTLLFLPSAIYGKARSRY